VTTGESVIVLIANTYGRIEALGESLAGCDTTCGEDDASAVEDHWVLGCAEERGCFCNRVCTAW
jgi:hypothetical protein